MPDSNDARRAPRLYPRGSTRLEVFRDPAGSGPDLAVRVLDVSASGAKIVLTEPLPVGHAVGLALYGPHLLPIAGEARVVWVRDADEHGHFVTGVELTIAATPEHLAALTRP